jgi:hypothetical protein
MFAACPGFLGSYWSAGFGTFLQVSALASYWLEECAKCSSTPEENNKYTLLQGLLKMKLSSGKF